MTRGTALPPLESCAERLELVFPKAAFDTVHSNPLAALAVFTFLFIDAVVGDEYADDQTWLRPSMVLWMSDAVIERADDPSVRASWTRAAHDRKAIVALHESWGIAHEPRYSDNSRETLRDETFKRWLENGALVSRPGVATTSSAPRWALTQPFADLFDPGLTGEHLLAAIEDWRGHHMSPGAKARALFEMERGKQLHEVAVRLPNGRERFLEPGDASLILKGVIETWAPHRMSDPAVLAISEPGEKVFTGDERLLARLGLHINVSTLLPDAVLVDLGSQPVTFWIVEAVATDGPVDEQRKAQLLSWAEQQGIPPADCQFLSAFVSRHDAPARRRLKDLARNTFAWYADEPLNELAWYGLQ